VIAYVVVGVAVVGFIGVGVWTYLASTKTELAPYGSERVRLTDADRDALVSAARGCLMTGSVDASAFSAALKKPYKKDVFLAAFAPEAEWLQGRGRESTIAGSMQTACRVLRENPTFPTRFGKRMEQTRVGVYLVDEVKKLKSRDAKDIGRTVEPGIHGLIIYREGKVGYQLPEEVLYYGWGMKGFGDKDRVAGAEMANMQLGRLSGNAGLRTDAWKDKEKAELYYFTTHSMVEKAPGQAMETYRGMVLYPKEITRSELLERAWLAGRNLAMHTDQEGKLGYHYRPTANKFTKDYNIVRHAGSVWGLFTAYKATGDKELLEAGRRALAYLEPNIAVPPENEKIALLMERGRSYLGSNALTTLSLIEIPQELLTPEWKEKREKLGKSLIAFQADNGLFYGDWGQVLKGGPPPIPQPRYYPGEAFLALVSLYEADGQKIWLEAAKKCAETQMREWDKKPTQQPDAWVVQAMSKLYRHHQDKRLPEYVFKMVAWHFEHQWGMPEKDKKVVYEDYFGGADNSTPPRSTPTSARTEANVEAWHLAKLVGNEEMAKKLGDCILAAFWHNFVDQFMPLTTYFLQEPQKAIGGIRGSLITDDIRIDYNQHFLSSAINGLPLAEERSGVGEFSPLAKGRIIDVGKAGADPAAAAQQLAGTATP
jgi:AMMECR1 domain-containing protein